MQRPGILACLGIRRGWIEFGLIAGRPIHIYIPIVYIDSRCLRGDYIYLRASAGKKTANNTLPYFPILPRFSASRRISPQTLWHKRCSGTEKCHDIFIVFLFLADRVINTYLFRICELITTTLCWCFFHSSVGRAVSNMASLGNANSPLLLNTKQIHHRSYENVPCSRHCRRAFNLLNK